MNAHEMKAPAALREALRLQENARAAGVPAFECVARRIKEEPSPLAAPRWAAGKSARLAASLALAQLRVIPRTVLPCALAVAAAATCTACWMVAGGDAAVAVRWFAVLLLAGVALSVAAALSPDRADALSLAMPLGPQTVTIARLAAVLGVDALAALAASVALSALAWQGAPLDLGSVVAAWLVPFAAVAGAASFAAVWTGSAWAGAVAGAALAPLAAGVAQAALDGGGAVLFAGLRVAVGPEGVVALGVALLAATICTARRAALARLRVA